jgi:hypothetical protein
MEDQEKARKDEEKRKLSVERVQIGARMEKRMVKVLKGLAEYHDLSLGDLLEGIVLHAFENESPFSEETLIQIKRLKEIYQMDYSMDASHRMTDPREKRDWQD